jgi:hypothetical protein
MSGVKKQEGLRRVSSYAKEINEQKNPSTASDFVTHSKAAIEFQIMTLQSELKLLEELSNVSDDAKLVMLFDLMDRNHDGYLSAVELADGLVKIRVPILSLKRAWRLQWSVWKRLIPMRMVSWIETSLKRC